MPNPGRNKLYRDAAGARMSRSSLQNPANFGSRLPVNKSINGGRTDIPMQKKSGSGITGVDINQPLTATQRPVQQQMPPIPSGMINPYDPNMTATGMVQAPMPATGMVRPPMPGMMRPPMLGMARPPMPGMAPPMPATAPLPPMMPPPGMLPPGLEMVQAPYGGGALGGATPMPFNLPPVPAPGFPPQPLPGAPIPQRQQVPLDSIPRMRGKQYQ